MATCKYTFTGADGKSITVEGIPALKEFLLQGALEQYLPSRAAEMLAPKADEDVGRNNHCWCHGKPLLAIDFD